MKENNDFELLQKQFENNILDWYQFEENIDYIILKDFSKDKIDELKNAILNLKENSKILILMDNNLAVKNISKDIDNEDKLFNRNEIEELLDKNDLIYRKFYYSLTDNKFTNVIFTDEHLPDEETLSRNIVFYKENDLKKNDEIQQYKKIIKQDPNLFKIFSNSFLIECSKRPFKDNNIEFVSFANMRKEQYRIKTIIQGDFVYKQPANDKAKKHIEQIERNIDILNEINLHTLDTYEGLKIISKYQKGKETLDKVLIKYLRDGQVEEVNQIINDLYNKLKLKLEIIDCETNVFDKYDIKYDKKDIENLNFVKYGLWDLIFQNIFYIDKEFYFYDQEWIEENIPLEFIIYRQINIIKELKELINFDEKKELFNINDKNIELFKELDNKLQESIRSELSWKLHTEYTNINNTENSIKILKKDKEKITQDCIKLLNEKDSRIKFLEENMEQTCNILREKEQELQYMKNSVSWKITKPLRNIRAKKRLI